MTQDECHDKALEWLGEIRSSTNEIKKKLLEIQVAECHLNNLIHSVLVDGFDESDG